MRPDAKPCSIQLVALLLLSTALAEAAAGRGVLGERAPDLAEHVSWLRGDPVPRFERGRVYVLQLWATWCPPCFVEMPHLNELADAYAERGVTVLGLAVGVDAGQPPEAFLQQHEERMRYPVAREIASDRLKGLLLGEGEELQLPLTMIVDREGRLAWRSDRDEGGAGLDAALARVLEGAVDLESLAAAEARRAAAREQATPLLEAAGVARRDGAFGEAARLYAQAAALDGTAFGTHAVDAFVMRSCAGEADAAARDARMAIESGTLDHPSELARLERAILHHSGGGRRDYDLARHAARRANETLGGAHPDFLFDLAKIELAAGEAERAAELQRRAVEAAREQGWMPGYVGFIGRPDALALSMANDAAHWRGACDVRDAGSR